MKQDTIPPFRFEVVKYISAISGTDTVYKFETVPVYLDHQRVETPKLPRVEQKPKLTAFDFMQPHEPVVFNAEPPMAEQLAYLLEAKPKTSEPSYPMNAKFQGASVALAIIMIGVVAVKLHLLYEKFCNAHSRSAGGRVR